MNLARLPRKEEHDGAPSVILELDSHSEVTSSGSGVILPLFFGAELQRFEVILDFTARLVSLFPFRALLTDSSSKPRSLDAAMFNRSETTPTTVVTDGHEVTSAGGGITGQAAQAAGANG